MTDNPYSAPQSDSISPAGDSPETETYDRIGGWLILIGIGATINPLIIAATIFFTSVPPFFNGTWQVVTTPGNPAYHSMWGVVLAYELLMNIVLFGWSILTAFLFFGKRKALPRVIIGFLAANLALTLIDFLLARQIPLVQQQVGDTLAANLSRPLVACLIWIPYFNVSKRVKGTFIR